MTHRSRQFNTLFVLAAGVSVLAGCPVPVSYTTATSAPVTGRIIWDDGTPARGLPIVLAAGLNDGSCGNIALQTTTDSSGAFSVEGTSEHHSVAWLVPNLDVAAPRFDLCASVGDTLRHIYRGFGSLQASAESASVSCTILRWEGTVHASCNDRNQQNVVSGGQWQDSSHSGRQGLYRVLLTAQPTHVKGYKKGYKVDRPYVYVQWLEPIGADSAQRFRIDTTVSLPIDRDKVTDVNRVQLWRREGRWMTSLEGYKKSFMNDFDHAELIYVLGAPGDVAKVSGP